MIFPTVGNHTRHLKAKSRYFQPKILLNVYYTYNKLFLLTKPDKLL